MVTDKRKEKILPKFTFINNRRVIEENRLDMVKGQGSIFLSVLENLPMPTDSREVSRAMAAHPEFKTKMNEHTAGGLTPAGRVVNTWLYHYKKLGLIKMVTND